MVQLFQKAVLGWNTVQYSVYIVKSAYLQPHPLVIFSEFSNLNWWYISITCCQPLPLGGNLVNSGRERDYFLVCLEFVPFRYNLPMHCLYSTCCMMRPLYHCFHVFFLPWKRLVTSTILGCHFHFCLYTSCRCLMSLIYLTLQKNQLSILAGVACKFV